MMMIIQEPQLDRNKDQDDTWDGHLFPCVANTVLKNNEQRISSPLPWIQTDINWLLKKLQILTEIHCLLRWLQRAFITNNLYESRWQHVFVTKHVLYEHGSCVLIQWLSCLHWRGKVKQGEGRKLGKGEGFYHAWLKEAKKSILSHDTNF